MYDISAAIYLLLYTRARAKGRTLLGKMFQRATFVYGNKMKLCPPCVYV